MARVEISNIIERIVIKENEKSFSQSVEDCVWEKDISYFDAVIEVMTSKNIEPNQAAKLLSKDIKTILKHEASELSLLKK